MPTQSACPTQVDGGELTRNALSLCDWEPSDSATEGLTENIWGSG